LGSPEEASSVLSDFSTQLATSADDVSAISPPDDVADLHNRLVDELNDLSSEAMNAANEISAGGQAAVAGVTTAFIAEAGRLGAEADATIDEINAKLRE
jgi:hypothetical protein